MSGKGGVGKSSLTVNLAAVLQAEGYRVGIVDADINGASIVQMTGVARNPSVGPGGVQPPVAENGVQVMSIDLFLEKGEPVEWASTTNHSSYTWRGMVEVGTVRELLSDTDWSPLDFLLIDLPPGTDKLPNLLDIVPDLAGAIVVTVPSRASQYVVRKSLQIARGYLGDRPIGLVENMATFVCDSCQKEHRLFPGGEETAWDAEFGVTWLGSIPFDPELSQRVDSGMMYYSSEHTRPASSALKQVAESVLSLFQGEKVL